MSDPQERPEPVSVAPDVPLDQTAAPIDYLQEGVTGEVPLDQTRSEMREFLGSQDQSPGKRRPLW
jgi:hypothetical protein